MDLGFLANQGTGWALFIASLGVIIYLFKGWLDEKDKRAADGKDYLNGSLGTIKDLTNAIGTLQKTEEANSIILQGLRK